MFRKKSNSRTTGKTAVASLPEHVLQTIQVQVPHMTDVYLHSDYAGYYHYGYLRTANPSFSDRTGVWLSLSPLYIFYS